MKNAQFFIDQSVELISEIDGIIEDENFGKIDFNTMGVDSDVKIEKHQEQDKVRLLYMRIKAMLGEFDNGKAFLEELAYVTKSTATISSRFAFGWNEKERMNIYKNVLLSFVTHLNTYRITNP